jgi:hypothetical protein
MKVAILMIASGEMGINLIQLIWRMKQKGLTSNILCGCTKKQKAINADRPKLIKHIKLQEIFIAAYHQVPLMVSPPCHGGGACEFQ